MKLSLRSLFAAAGMFLASAGLGQAEEISLAPQFEPFAAPQVQATDITLVNHCCDSCNNGAGAGCGDAGAGGCCDSCTSCCPSRHVGRDFWVCKDRSCGWVGGVDFLMLKPFASENSMANGGNAQLNYNPAFRIYFGRQNADGLGWRMRLFDFERSASAINGVLGVKARYYDAELTQAVDFRRWNLLFSGGLRYAQTNFENGTGGPVTIASFNGVGLTFAAQAARDLNQSGSLRMLSSARWSAVYGNTSFNGGTTTDRDDLINIMELQLGPQYRRQLRNGGYLTLGGGLEAQYWNGANGASFTDTQNFGFAGFFTSVGITR